MSKSSILYDVGEIGYEGISYEELQYYEEKSVMNPSDKERCNTDLRIFYNLY